MSQHADFANITPGTPVFDALGAARSPVEAIDATSLRVQGHDVPLEQIAPVEMTGVPPWALYLAVRKNPNGLPSRRGGSGVVVGGLPTAC